MEISRTIESLQNPLVKQLTALREKSRDRRKTGLFVIEGRRELSLALGAGYQVHQILFCPEIGSEEELWSTMEDQTTRPELITLSKRVYERLAYRKSTEGILAVAKGRSHRLSDLKMEGNPLLLIAEAPEKPGNIGALLRTADAAGLDGVVIAGAKTDLYNPNIIRSSIGCVFTMSVAMAETHEIIPFLKNQGVSLYCAALSASIPYTEVDYRKATAIVVGTESIGLTQEWLDASDQNILIPMAGQIDSMNVSVSAAILIFEARRQRGFAKNVGDSGHTVNQENDV